MDDVQFNDEDPLISSIRPVVHKKTAKTGVITHLAIASGFAKTEEEANVILLVFAVGLLCITVGVVFFNNSTQGSSVTPDQVQANLNPSHAK